MFCPYCGVENPDFMWQCGSCGRSLLRPAESATTPAVEGQQPAPELVSGFGGTPGGNPRRLPTYKLNAAVIAVVVGIALDLIGFILYAYYYERITDPHRNFDEIMDLYNLAKYSTYATFAGVVATLVGVAFIIQATMAGGLCSALAAARRIPLRGVLMLVIAMIVLWAVVTGVDIFLGEFEPDLSVSTMRLVSRMLLYMPEAAAVLGHIALLIVTVSLRNASLGRGAFNT